MPPNWVPLEASPDIFNQWARPVGLPSSPLSFQDLFSLDEDFLAFVPQPVKAVLLLFPSRGALYDARKKEDEETGGTWKGEGVWWIKQTIGNACGSIGMLHALLNLPESGPHSLKPGSSLLKFKEESLKLDIDDRAKLLTETEFFEQAHKSVAEQGQSSIPTDNHVDEHFIAFIQANNDKGESRVVELDGGRKGPFDRGQCTDLLRDVAKVVKEKYIDRAEGDISFNMMVLAGEPDD